MRFLIFLNITISILFLSGCSQHNIDNWEKWCEHLNDVDLEKKYSKGLFFSVSFDIESIRNDFVDKYNEITIQYISEKYLGEYNKNDEVISELSRLKMIGVWRERTHLHLANSLIFSEEFELWAERFREYLKNLDQLDDFQYCLFATINSLFEDFTLHGIDETQLVTIPLEYSMKSYDFFKKN